MHACLRVWVHVCCPLCGSLAMGCRWEWGAAAASSPTDQRTRALWTHCCLPPSVPPISHPDVQPGLFSSRRGSGNPPWHVHTGCCPRGETHGRTRVEEWASALGAIDRLCSCVRERGDQMGSPRKCNIDWIKLDSLIKQAQKHKYSK